MKFFLPWLESLYHFSHVFKPLPIDWSTSCASFHTFSIFFESKLEDFQTHTCVLIMSRVYQCWYLHIFPDSLRSVLFESDWISMRRDRGIWVTAGRIWFYGSGVTELCLSWRSIRLTLSKPVLIYQSQSGHRRTHELWPQTGQGAPSIIRSPNASCSDTAVFWAFHMRSLPLYSIAWWSNLPGAHVGVLQF